MSTPDNRQVTVVGAGVVGMSTAVYLQRHGFAVTVIDRGPPGEECSLGNAGMLGTASCVPIAMPGVLAKVPRMLFPDGPLKLRWSLLPRLVPWLTRFVASARPARVAAIADAMHALQRQLVEAHLDLLEDAGKPELVKRVGKLHMYETAGQKAAAAAARALQRERGIVFDELDAGAARDLVPQLGDSVHGGTYFPDVCHCLDPLALVRAYAELFQRRGGVLLREEVRGFDLGPEGPERIHTDAGSHAAETVVIATGAWSRNLARPFGARVPVEAERGYHVMLPNPGLDLPMPIKPEGRGIIITPMQAGIRVTGIAEFGGLDADPDPRHFQTILRHARAVLPGLVTEGGSEWMGHRPSTPDSLPVLDRSPRFAKVFFAFGHGHFGLGLGAISGRLVAELVAGITPSIDPKPYRASRFALIS
jgi:D-amino-acid dehydrogenase